MIESNEPEEEEVYLGQQESACFKVFCWILQLGSWATLILAIIQLKNDKYIYFAYFGIVYLFYLIMEFCSNTFKYIKHKSSEEGIYEIMGKIFQTPPKIKLYCECYHTKYYRKSHKSTSSSQSYRKVVTHTESYDIPYYSARDVSGLFSLDSKKENLKKKHLLRLELEEEISFADEISYYDYMIQKGNFWRTNKDRIEKFYFKEYRTIPNMEHHYLINLDNDEPCFVNLIVFIIFIILMLGEIYKIIFNSYCLYIKFKVRKLVSTRNDLNQPKYQTLIPHLDIYDQQFTYADNYYNYLDVTNVAILPTEEELKVAQKFKNKIPDYKVSSEEENMKAGIVIDDPNYKFDPHEAPSKFESYGISNVNYMNYPVNQNQMNTNINQNQMNMNMNFNQDQMNMNFNQNQMNTNTNENQFMYSELQNLNKV